MHVVTCTGHCALSYLFLTLLYLDEDSIKEINLDCVPVIINIERYLI